MKDGSWSITRNEEAEETRAPTPDPTVSVDLPNVAGSLLLIQNLR